MGVALRVSAVALRHNGAPLPSASDVVSEQALWLMVSIDDAGAPVTGLTDDAFAIRIVRPPSTAITPVPLVLTDDDGEPQILPMVSAAGLDGFYAVRCLRPPNTYLSTDDYVVEVAVTASNGRKGQAIALMSWPRELFALTMLSERLDFATKKMREIQLALPH